MTGWMAGCGVMALAAFYLAWRCTRLEHLLDRFRDHLASPHATVADELKLLDDTERILGQ